MTVNFLKNKDQDENAVSYGTNADFRLLDQQDEFADSKFDVCVEIMDDLVKDGFKPVFSIPRQFILGKTKLTPNKTWLQDKVLAGTLGIQPYNPEGDRILCIYQGDLKSISLKPRLTGPGRQFQGVVATLSDIPLSECVLWDTKTGKQTSLIEINNEALSEADESPKTKEKLEKMARRAELDEIFKKYEPQKLLGYLKKFAEAEYSAMLGPGFKNFTIGDHTLRVLVQFEKYFRGEDLPAPMSRDFLRLILALHDLGKKQALEAGDSRLQTEFNKQEMQKMLERFGYNLDQILLAKTLVGFDPIGTILKSKSPKETARLQFLRMQEISREFKIPVDKLYELLKIYYMSDASAYTKDAKFPAMLDELFDIDLEFQKIYFSPKTEEKLEPLEDLVYGN